MRVSSLILLLPLALGGCLSFSSSPAPRETVVVPQGTTVVPAGSEVVCANGTRPPC